MLGKGVTVMDCLVAVAVVLPVGLLAGAALGYYGDKAGMSGGLRLLAIVALAGVSGHIGRAIVARRVKGRSSAGPK
jgi:hypothetical protein